MTARCISHNTGFGVVSKPNDDISTIGTYVVISKILKKYPTGETDIVVSGLERFRILEYGMNSDGYYEADIEDYRDETSGFDSNLLNELREKFEKILNRTNLNMDSGFWQNFENSATKSFKIAEKSGLKLSQQQELLNLKDENERLNYLINYFENLEVTISENMIMKNLILGDGYIN